MRAPSVASRTEAASRTLKHQIVEVDETATHLERADRRVVFMLDPHLCARPRPEQRPLLLRGWSHRFVDHRRRRVEFRQGHLKDASRA